MDINLKPSWEGHGTLKDLVTELQRQKDTKHDFVADTRDLKVVVEKEPETETETPHKANLGGIGQTSGFSKEEKFPKRRLLLQPTSPRASEWLPKAGLPIRMNALLQVAERSNPAIPTRFARSMAEERPEELAALINDLMAKDPKRRFIRTLDNQVRSFMSNKYRVLDHYDLAFSALDAVRAVGGVPISVSLSETRMRIKFSTKRLADVLDGAFSGQKNQTIKAGDLGNPEYLKKIGFTDTRDGFNGEGGSGDTVHPIVELSNSETGHGGYSVKTGLFVWGCANSMIVGDQIGKVHLGSKLDVGVFSEQTLSQESKTIYLQSRDVVKAAFNPEVFKKMVDIAKGAANKEIKGPAAAIENVAKAAGISDDAKDALLAHFIRDYAPTQLGVAQAVSRLAQDESNADASAKLEKVAGNILKGEVSLVA